MKPIKRGLIIILLLIIIVIVGIVAFLLYQNSQIKNEVSQKISTIFPSLNTENLPNNKKIVFEKDLGTNSDGKIISEIWIMNTDGTGQEKLNLPQPNPGPLNIISDGWVFYTALYGSRGSTIYAYNYITGQSKQIVEKDQLTAVVNVSYWIVSPDSKKIAYDVTYDQLVNGSPSCGQYPCGEADLYPDHKSGTYVYNIETDKKTYIGHFDYGEFWSADSNNILYSFVKPENYHEYVRVGSYSIDVSGGKSSFLGSIKDQVFDSYKLYQINGNNQEQIIYEDWQTSDGGGGGYIIKVDKGNKETTIDSSLGLGCCEISPDSKHVLYSKGDGGAVSNILLLDLSKLTTKVVLKSSPDQSYGSMVWVSDTQFVTENAVGDKHNLILVNINSGKIQSLTTSDNARF